MFRPHRAFRVLACSLCFILIGFSSVGASFNSAPKLEGNLYHTVENVPVYGHVRVFDPEGDIVTLSLNVKPIKGTVLLQGSSFRYTPYPGSHGSDTFSLVACDSYGNRSNTAAIAVSIEGKQGLAFFCDMDRDPHEYSAMRLAKTGVLSGESMGNQQFFYSNREMNGGEWIVALLAARGWEEDLETCVNTGLKNDAQIPLWLKPYIRRAINCGILTEPSFDTQCTLTRAQAVLLTDRAAQIDDILKYNLLITDRENIPEWAMPSYINLSAYRMLDLYDGMARPKEPLTRGYAAALLWQLYQYAQLN